MQLFLLFVFWGFFGDSDWLSQGLDFDGGQSDEVEKERKSDARLTSWKGVWQITMTLKTKD